MLILGSPFKGYHSGSIMGSLRVLLGFRDRLSQVMLITTGASRIGIRRGTQRKSITNSAFSGQGSRLRVEVGT